MSTLCFCKEFFIYPSSIPSDIIEFINSITSGIFFLKPTDCLIIEDNENGIKAARASGAYVLQVADTNQVTHSRILQEINGIENG